MARKTEETEAVYCKVSLKSHKAVSPVSTAVYTHVVGGGGYECFWMFSGLV